MQPKLYTFTSKKGDIGGIISCISNFNCSSFFNSFIGKTQSEQKKIINKFQNDLYNHLKKNNNNKNIKWQLEYSPNFKRKDSIDIFGSNNQLIIVIELDKHRADQVAKKFLSRNALLEDRLFYISLCYPRNYQYEYKGVY